MGIRPLRVRGSRPQLRGAGTRASSHVARPEASRGHSVRWPRTVRCLRRGHCPNPVAQASVDAHAVCLHFAATRPTPRCVRSRMGPGALRTRRPADPLPVSWPRPSEDASWRRPEHGGGSGNSFQEPGQDARSPDRMTVATSCQGVPAWPASLLLGFYGCV